jgi:tetratricopeptide (TPR) repeat protein
VRSPALLTAVTLAAGASTAHANEPLLVERARALSDTGRAAHDRGDYERAISAFKEAYVIAPAPGLLFNLAQAYRLQGKCDEAVIMYRRYLSTRPSDDARALAQTHLDTVERCARPAPSRGDLAGAYVTALEARSAELGGGASVELSALHVDRSRTAQRKKEIGLGVALGGGAALAIATYYGFRASAAADDVERAYQMGAKWRDVAARHEDGERAARIAQVFGIGGVAGIATGVTVYVLGKRAERTLPVVTPTADGARVSVGWRF